MAARSSRNVGERRWRRAAAFCQPNINKASLDDGERPSRAAPDPSAAADEARRAAEERIRAQQELLRARQQEAMSKARDEAMRLQVTRRSIIRQKFYFCFLFTSASFICYVN